MTRSARRLALGVLCAAQCMLIVDVVALNVALPSMQRSLDIPMGQLQFTGIAYTLTFGSLLIVAGRAGDLVGRRRLFQVGLAVFTVASLVSAGAQSAGWLFAGRALQGVGAAMVSPTALALLTSMFAEGTERNRALGVWAAVGSGGAIAGQLLGGVLTDLLGWPSIFLINVPVAGFAIVAARHLIPESRGRVRGPLDVRGAALLSAGVAALTLALTSLAENGVDAGFVIRGAFAVGLLGGFVVAERAHPAPLLRMDLLRSPAVRSGNAVLALLAGGTAGALFFTTLYLQGVLGYSAMEVGAAFAPATLIVLGVSPLAGRLAGRVGVRTLLVGGAGLTGVGLLLLSAVGVEGSYLVDVLPGLAVVALGNGLAFAPTMIAGTAGVDHDNQGFASGLLGTSQELGTALGLALVAPIAAAAAARAGDLAASAGAATSGYRVGYLAAAALVAAAVAIAWRTPSGVGRTDARPAPESNSAGRGTGVG